MEVFNISMKCLVIASQPVLGLLRIGKVPISKWNNDSMNCWVTDVGEKPIAMEYWVANQVSFFHSLAKIFLIPDSDFACHRLALTLDLSREPSTLDLYGDSADRATANSKDLSQFFVDAVAGSLPQFSFFDENGPKTHITHILYGHTSFLALIQYE
jgi:hypothetical protein